MNLKQELKQNKKTNSILWLGSFQSPEMFNRMKARIFGEASGYTSQKGLISGIDSLIDVGYTGELDSIACSIAYPPYPQYPEKKVEREVWSRTGTSFDVSIGYLNTKFLRYFSRAYSLNREIKKWIKERSGKKNTVIIYEPSMPKLNAAIRVKKEIGASIYLIIPDIPELVALGANPIKRIIKKCFSKVIRRQFELVDGFILYSEHMAEYYNIPNDKWICVEGVFDPKEVINFHKKENKNICLMYSGALDEYRGIPQLLDAFDSLHDDNYELWLTGAGRSEKLIMERAKKDNRIKYFGFLKTREEVIKLEYQADVLIHMRDTNSPAAPYCFPSKIFEYLVTGNPVISVDIQGIPRDYFKYMIRIDDMSIDKINEAIRKAVKMPKEERVRLGKEGRSFILKNKTSQMQARKMLEFMKVL